MDKFKKDYRTDKLLKDRGDNLRKNKQNQRTKPKYEPDRGDSFRNKPSEKTSESDKRSEVKREHVKLEPVKRQSECEKEANRTLDRWRWIRDKYTVKNYILSDVTKHDNNKGLIRDSKKDMDKFKKDYRTDKLLKDRGDNLRKNKQNQRTKPKYEPDRGDSFRNKPSEKTSESDKRSEVKREHVKLEPVKRQSECEKEANRTLDRWRWIRDKYTVKNYILSDVTKHDNNKGLIRDSKKDTSSNSQRHTEVKDKMDFNKSTKEKPAKVPVIRTITSKNDAKVFKAVTFTAPKLNHITPIQINIPTATTKKTRISKIINQNKIKTTSKTSVKPVSERKKTSERKRKHWHMKQVSSPVLTKEGDSPPTEVAKWAPNCINKHTKPYYEAWVNTTLAAIPKKSNNKRFVDDRNYIWTFRRGLEIIESPELVYKDYKDERYAGKIKVNRK